MKFLGLGAAAATLGRFAPASWAQPATQPSHDLRPPMFSSAAINPDRRRVLRVAHMTDIHVQPERGAGEGLAMALRHLQGQADKPQLILNTGDSVMDCFAKGKARTQLIWDLWHDTLRNELTTPIRHAIGNHDIWGWNKTKSKTDGSEPLWGKATALDGYDLKNPY
ncbi:MAG TPA: metallophosphoesterase family protein, partial [Tepidisphaeraceae bacterium]